MKKFLSFFLAILMIASVALLTGCNGNKEEKDLKLGLGVYAEYGTVESAKDDATGKGQVVATVAAVLLDANGKIVKCELDCADNTVQYTSEGKFVSVDSFKTKDELGDSYGMKSSYGSTKEWYQHVDAFEKLVAGKTVAEVKALVVNGDKGNSDVINAGCTITINEFVLAIEKAAKNAKASSATSEHTLKLGTVTEMTGTDATADKAGSIELDTSFVAAAVASDGKVVAATSDVLASKLSFDVAGVSSTDTAAALSTKGELGDAYGMKSPYGSTKEWYEHAAAFDTACVGKTASEIAGLATAEGKASEALQTAGCTITVSGLVKAAVKAATIG